MRVSLLPEERARMPKPRGSDDNASMECTKITSSLNSS